MNRRDEELLAKQMRTIVPPKAGLPALALAGVFAAGLVLGALLFAPVEQNPPHDAIASLPAATLER